MYKGQLEGFPVEVVEKMLDEQVKQGNVRDVSVFELKVGSNNSSGGFTWGETIEGGIFWNNIIRDKNFDLFFEKYPKKKEPVYPKVMLVADSENMLNNKPLKRVVFMEKCGKYLAWTSANTIDSSEVVTSTFPWPYAKDVEPEMTIEEAIIIMDQHEKWRQGGEGMQTVPAILTRATATLLSFARAHENDKK